jgi:hypothetical protein
MKQLMLCRRWSTNDTIDERLDALFLNDEEVIDGCMYPF